MIGVINLPVFDFWMMAVSVMNLPVFDSWTMAVVIINLLVFDSWTMDVMIFLFQSDVFSNWTSLQFTFIMEYTFISKETFETLLNNYLNPNNFHICDKNTRNWAMKCFCLEEVVPGDFRVLVKAGNKPVLVVENMYKILCQTHAEIDQHGGQKQLWKSIKER
ncbi:hypothetical protein FOMMEDRAFT_81080 [Rhizophagus clarus]|uniref:Uncharacterized protein n=1 Tax=Rhizophagus clarus TaxID=94130 RepID=A0A8H3L2M1_9GLOM|nr:hypothetical protein FOMMEDRAFT_81080 [Rhizophagus clarus]